MQFAVGTVGSVAAKTEFSNGLCCGRVGCMASSCLFRELEVVHALLHLVHWYGLSPVWVRLCSFRPLEVVHAWLHLVHWYRLSPV